MTIDEIRELIQLATETGIAELEVQRGDNRVRIRRAGFAATQEIVMAAPAPPASPAADAPRERAEKPERTEKPRDPNLHLVKSPIVGTFYEGPSPGAPPFV